MGIIKQRSPAGARWAGRTLDHVEKIHHVESSILGAVAPAVKLTRRLSVMLIGLRASDDVDLSAIRTASAS